ncbi:protein KAKU4 isoform X1 [Melia azedarach]|uniref:Protein KAKU4 isoform X1 n=1 Tax=Melia azedarach TaxID=155640 RepID=A0ACC1X8D2_MELAZ|nr:protein KAKU4 isoform X1 [Melia azedarach]
MASIPTPWRAGELRSGGKMIRARRTARATTPYERPELPPNSSPQNPNWLSRLIYSPTRMIASGAGKILSSVFTNESSSSSSSSSDSGDEFDDENDDNGISSDGTDTMRKNGTSEIIQHARSEPQPVVVNGETKHLIEQLLMHVTFSREECERLTSIIKSRVVDGPIIGDTKDQRLGEQPNRTIGCDVDMPDLCSAAVMEAKKWLEEKKSGSSPKTELDYGPCTLNCAMLPHVIEGEVGSPVDMAKSYMRTRPPWASPTVTPTEYRSPSLTGIQLFKEETPYSTGYTSLTSSKMKRDSSASASWNILEEIRKVRTKATEEMLRTPPSSKIDWSSYGLENKNVSKSFLADEAEASMRSKVHSSIKSVDASRNLAKGVSTSYGPVSQVIKDGLQNEAVPPNPATFVSEQNQDLENIQVIEETSGRFSSGQREKSLENIKTMSQSNAGAANFDDLKDTNGTSQPPNSLMGGTVGGLKVVLALNAVPDSGLNDQKCSTSKEMAGKGGSFAVNGFPSSGFSLPTGQDREENSRPSDENQNPVASGHDEVPSSIPMGEDCQFFNEAPIIDVPVTYENESFATGSQDSSSMQNEGLSLNMTTPNSRRRGQGKKPGRPSRRGRGRGK